MMDEYGIEFIIIVRQATRGDILMRHNVAAMNLDFTWKLKLRLADQLRVSSPFDLRLVQGTIELDDAQMLRTYEDQGCSRWKLSHKHVGLAPDEKKHE